MGRPRTRRGISISRYSPCSARDQLSSDGVAEPSTRGTFSGGRPGRGDLPGVIPRGRLLLERRLVLLVQHDQPEVRRRGEDGAAGAHHDGDLAVGDPLPVPVPLGVGQVTVQHRHAAEPQPEPLDRLRRQADLRHQHNRLPPVIHHLPDRLHVDLRLAAAGHSVEQDGLVSARAEGVEDRSQGFLLIGIENVRFFRAVAGSAAAGLAAAGSAGGLVGIRTVLARRRPLRRRAVMAARRAPGRPGQLAGGERLLRGQEDFQDGTLLVGQIARRQLGRPPWDPSQGA